MDKNPVNQSPANSGVFTISATGEYHRDEIPPRCRKPRLVRYEATATVQVPVLTEDDAPVAFRVTELEKTIEVRTHAGNLFRPHLPAHLQAEPTVPGSGRFPVEVKLQNHELTGSITSDEEFAAAVQEKFGRFIIVDGVVWVECEEPRYIVTTFGAGHNHGSTALMIDWSDNSNHRAESYFRADEFEEAVQYAIEVAAGRGDDLSATRFQEDGERYRYIEILIPESVTLVTVPATPPDVRALRIDYQSAISRLRDAANYDVDQEAEAFARVVELRQQIIAAGHSPVESDARPYEAR
ncbi:hypothetical protein LG293_15925 (plasmid) [Citricoccus nitrophenolicus]